LMGFMLMVTFSDIGDIVGGATKDKPVPVKFAPASVE